MTFLSTVVRDGLMDVSQAYSYLIFNTSTTDLCRTKVWVIMICTRRVSTESNRKKRHSSVHLSISSSSCRNRFRYWATCWCLLDEQTRSSREKVIDQTSLQTKRKNDVTCSSFSSSYLSFSARNLAKINLEPLIPAVSAPVEYSFWSEVTKVGTHFSLKISSSEGRQHRPGFLLMFRQPGLSSVSPIFFVIFQPSPEMIRLFTLASFWPHFFHRYHLRQYLQDDMVLRQNRFVCWW